MHGQPIQVRLRDPGNVRCLAAGRLVATDEVRPKRQRELLPHFSVVVCHDVVRVRVDADEANDLDPIAGLLKRLSLRGVVQTCRWNLPTGARLNIV